MFRTAYIAPIILEMSILKALHFDFVTIPVAYRIIPFMHIFSKKTTSKYIVIRLSITSFPYVYYSSSFVKTLSNLSVEKKK